MSGPAAATSDLFDGVIGQERAIAQLRGSVRSPVHAFLLVGPPGAGSRQLADAFAGEVLAAADPIGAERHRTLARGRIHPAIRVFERVGAALTKEQALEVVKAAAMRPPEGDLQVLVLLDLHLVSKAAPVLLKTVEEPPESTVFVILADDIPPELVTIASRCMVIDVPPLSAGEVAEALRAAGVDDEQAELAAEASGGDLEHARLLVSDEHLAERHRFWLDLPVRLDGTGATAMRLVDEAVTLVDAVLEPLLARQAAEIAALDAVADQMGTARGGRKELEERHKREQRRIRTTELRAGLVTLTHRYRDAVSEGAPPSLLHSTGVLVTRTVDRLVFNPSEKLLLAGLFVDLPGLGGRDRT